MGDRALDRGAQLVYLGVEFFLPVKQRKYSEML